jgi:hypothetical protein
MHAQNEAEQIAELYKKPIKHSISLLFEELKSVIRLSATLLRNDAFFVVPALCIENPVHYNHNKMTRTLAKLIKRDGYKCSHRHNIIHVWWGAYKP